MLPLDIRLPSTGIIYFGDADTNGSTRLRASGSLIVYSEVRISGSWVPTAATVYASGDATGATDVVNIQAVVTALAAGGQSATRLTIHGDHYTNDDIDVTLNGLQIVGIGASITQKGTAKKTFNVTGDNVTIDGVRLIGLGTEDPWTPVVYSGVAGVYINGCSDVTVKNCVMTNHAGGGVVITGTNYRISVLNNSITGMGSPTIAAGKNGIDGAISMISGGICYGFLAHGNILEGHAFGVLGGYGDLHSYIGNNVRDIPGQHGFYLQSGPRILASGNHVYNCEDDGIKVSLNSVTNVDNAVAIISNKIEEVGQNGISVSQTVSSTTEYLQNNVSILSNQIYDAQYGINCRGTPQADVRGNTIRGCTLVATDLRNFSGSYIGNGISDCEGSVFLQTPIGSVAVSELDIVNTPLNVGDVNASYLRSAVALNTDDTSETISVGDIRWRYDGGTEPAGTYTPTACIRQYSSSGSPILRITGAIDNRSSAAPDILADDDVVPTNAQMIAATDANAADGTLYYSSDQSRLAYRDSSSNLLIFAPRTDDRVIKNTGPALYLAAEDLSAVGDAGVIVADWVNRVGAGEAFTVSGSPTYEVDGFTLGAPSVLFVAADEDHFYNAGTIINKTGTGTVIGVFKCVTVGAVQHFLSIAESTTTPASARYGAFGVDDTDPAKARGAIYIGTATDIMTGPSEINDGDTVVYVYLSDDTQYLFDISGLRKTVTATLGTNDGTWLNSISPAITDTTIGCLRRGDTHGTSSFMNGHIGHVLYWERQLAWSEIRRIVELLKARYAVD